LSYSKETTFSNSNCIVCLLMNTCKHKQRTSMTNRMQWIIFNEANDPSSTIQRYYPLNAKFWNWPKLHKDAFDALAFFKQRLSYSLIYTHTHTDTHTHKDLSNLKNLRDFIEFTSGKTLSKSIAHKHLENSYKLYILGFLSVRSYLNFNFCLPLHEYKV